MHQFASLSNAQIAMLAYGGDERRVPRYQFYFAICCTLFYVLRLGGFSQALFRAETGRQGSVGEHGGHSLAPRVVVCGVRLQRRSTNVRATSPCFHLDEEGLAGLAARASAAVITAALRRHSFFELLADATILEVAPLFRLEEYGRAGDTILEEGGPLDKVCLLLEGSVRLSMGGESIGALPESGEEQETIFGEAALLSSAASTLTVTSLEPCKLLALPRSKFGRALALMPNLKEQVRGSLFVYPPKALSARSSAMDAITTQSLERR